MITQVNISNSKQYETFWKEINELSSLNIHSIEEYFQNIEAISELAEGRYTRLPLDEPCFNIDANTRIIEIPSDFRKNGIGVKGDHIAEILYFRIARYYDTTDLARDDIDILFEWKLKNEDYILPYYLKDIESEPGYIIFGCPIDDRITEEAGSVQVAVRFIEKIKDNNSNITKINYSLSTLPATLAINPSLDFSIDVNINNTLNSLIKNRFKNSEASSAQASEPIILTTNLDSNRIEYVVLLQEYNNKPILYVSAFSPNGTTAEIKYKLYKDGSVIKTEAEEIYIPTKDIVINAHKDYYVITETNDYEIVSPDFTNDEITYYEKVYAFNFDGISPIAGDYKIQVINVVGYDTDGEGIVDKTYTKSIYTNTLNFPNPKKPTVNITNGNNLVFTDDNAEFILNTNVSNWEGNEKGASLSYAWYKDDQQIEGENSNTLKIESNEEERLNTTEECAHSYKAIAINNLHGQQQESDKSNECVVSYPPSAFGDIAITGEPKLGNTVSVTYNLINNKRTTSVRAEWYIDEQKYTNSNEDSLKFIIPEKNQNDQSYAGHTLSCKLINEYNKAYVESTLISTTIKA